MRIKLKIKTSSRPVGSHEVTDEALKKIVSNSRWIKGFATYKGNKFVCQRRKTLDDYEYRYKGEEIQPPETFNPSEFFDWIK